MVDDSSPRSVAIPFISYD
jgi:hypothetical protein